MYFKEFFLLRFWPPLNFNPSFIPGCMTFQMANTYCFLKKKKNVSNMGQPDPTYFLIRLKWLVLTRNPFDTTWSRPDPPVCHVYWKVWMITQRNLYTFCSQVEKFIFMSSYFLVSLTIYSNSQHDIKTKLCPNSSSVQFI